MDSSEVMMNPADGELNDQVRRDHEPFRVFNLLFNDGTDGGVFDVELGLLSLGRQRDKNATLPHRRLS